MSRQSWLGSLIALVAAVTLIMYSRAISEFLFSLFFEPAEKNATLEPVANINDKIGLVSVRRAGTNEFFAIRPPTALNHLDQIKIERAAKAEIVFLSEWKIDLQENTMATIELYRPDQESSPALLSIVKGNYTVTQPGKRGMLFIMRDKKVFSPDTEITPTPRAIELKAPAPATVTTTADSVTEPLSDTIPQASIDNVPIQELPSAANPGKMPDKIKNGDEETLSSRYIENVLSTQSADLRKCQLNSLRDNKTSTGTLLLSLTIAANGRVEHVKVLQDHLKNTQLISCTTSVIERTQFKSFEGLPITLTYPLEFK